MGNDCSKYRVIYYSASRGNIPAGSLNDSDTQCVVDWHWLNACHYEYEGDVSRSRSRSLCDSLENNSYWRWKTLRPTGMKPTLLNPLGNHNQRYGLVKRWHSTRCKHCALHVRKFVIKESRKENFKLIGSNAVKGLKQMRIHNKKNGRKERRKEYR